MVKLTRNVWNQRPDWLLMVKKTRNVWNHHLDWLLMVKKTRNVWNQRLDWLLMVKKTRNVWNHNLDQIITPLISFEKKTPGTPEVTQIRAPKRPASSRASAKRADCSCTKRPQQVQPAPDSQGPIMWKITLLPGFHQKLNGTLSQRTPK